MMALRASSSKLSTAMGIKLRSNDGDSVRNGAANSVQKYGRLLGALDLHAALRNGIVYAVLIFAIALLFYGVESFIEYFARDVDNVVDIVMAIASTFIFLWIRAMMRNARLSETLRIQSEERALALEGRMGFLAEIAHEFQTPIAILRGNIAVLAEAGGGVGETRRRRNTGRKPKLDSAAGAAYADLSAGNRANAIYVATTTLDRLSRLVTNLLDVAKLNFSKEKFKKQIVDVRKLAEEAVEDCAILGEDKNIAISTIGEAVLVAGDKDKLKEVLLNLLSNALKHTPAGGAIVITVSRTPTASRHDGSEEGDEAEIVVADTGSGIAPENLPQIFERFYRIENAAAPQNPAHASTGLGLHICRQIVEAHGGTISAESELGNGSRFIIHLPLCPSTARRCGETIGNTMTGSPAT